MKEQLYTIPINESFDRALESESPVCPFCLLEEMLEKNEIDRILGAAMMEPDVRIQTNEHGFCRHHFNKMFAEKNRLGLALILESHLAEIDGKVVKGKTLLDGSGERERAGVRKLTDDCYICSRIEETLFKMLKTTIFLWETEEEFRDKFKNQWCFCLPHYATLLEHGKSGLSKKDFPHFYEVLGGIEKKYLAELNGDVSWFCKKFDYRYDSEPWYNAKDSVSRALDFLSGTRGKDK